MPDLIFGYYSGSGRKARKALRYSPSRLLQVINKERSDANMKPLAKPAAYSTAVPSTGCLPCYPISPSRGKETGVKTLLTDKLALRAFTQRWLIFKEPSWFTNAQLEEEPIARLSILRPRTSHL